MIKKSENHSERFGKIISLQKNNEKYEFRTVKNAARFLEIGTHKTMVNLKKVAGEKGWSVSTRVDYDAYLDEEKFGPSEADKRHISSPEIKQQIRDEVDKFVSYCDTHYSTCNEVASKGLISEIDETDPVVIRFREFLKEHDV